MPYRHHFDQFLHLLSHWDGSPEHAAAISDSAAVAAVDLKKLFCYAVSVYNFVAARDNMPLFPVPDFCAAPPAP